MDFRDRHIVVSGGAGALGTAVVEALAGAGAICHVPCLHEAEKRSCRLQESKNIRLTIAGNLAEEAAALMESLANNHPFLDGNKRVAFDATHTFLLVNGFTIVADPAETYVFMIDSMAQGRFRLPFILDWINAHSRPLP